jgi:hypothetical protein
VPAFGGNAQLAQSRGLNETDLPGVGIGASGGLHVYVLRFGAVTVGVGGEATIGRSRSSPASDANTASPRAVTETFKSLTGQLSLNFGTGNGWSYLSVGLGRSIRSIVPDGRPPLAVDEDATRAINYGGGARWFAKKHLAFSLDVRLHEIPVGIPEPGLPASPHTLLLVIGAGVSVK